MADIVRKTAVGKDAAVLANQGKRFLRFVDKLPPFFDNPVLDQAYRNALASRTRVMPDGSILQTRRSPYKMVNAFIPDLSQPAARFPKKVEVWLALKLFSLSPTTFRGHWLKKVTIKDEKITITGKPGTDEWTWIPGSFQVGGFPYKPTTAGTTPYRTTMIGTDGISDYYEIYPNGLQAYPLGLTTVETGGTLVDTRVRTYNPPDVGVMIESSGGASRTFDDTPKLTNVALGIAYECGTQRFSNSLTDTYSGTPTLPNPQGGRIIDGYSSWSGPLFYFPFWGVTAPQRLSDHWSTTNVSTTSTYAKSKTEFFGTFTRPAGDISAVSPYRNSTNPQDLVNPHMYHQNLIGIAVPNAFDGTYTWFESNCYLNFSAPPTVASATVHAVYCGKEISVASISGAHYPVFQQGFYYGDVVFCGLSTLRYFDKVISPTWGKNLITVTNGKNFANILLDVDPVALNTFAFNDPTFGDLYHNCASGGKCGLVVDVPTGTTPK